MIEPEIEASLNAAFPTEPVSDALKQRVENLTPLAPVVTGYKLSVAAAPWEVPLSAVGAACL